MGLANKVGQVVAFLLTQAVFLHKIYRIYASSYLNVYSEKFFKHVVLEAEIGEKLSLK